MFKTYTDLWDSIHYYIYADSYGGAYGYNDSITNTDHLTMGDRITGMNGMPYDGYGDGEYYWAIWEEA